MAVRLILSDIDGTILDNQNKIDSNLKDCIKQLNKKEIPFILASARSPQGMLALAEELNVMDNPIACFNGALVVKDLKEDNYTTILNHELDRTEVERIFNLLKQKFPQVTINLYSGVTWYVEKIDKWVKIEADITKLVPIKTDLKNIIVNSQIPIHKLLLIGDTDQITKALKFFQTRFPKSAFYLSKDNYLEVTNKQVSKEKALRELAKIYRLDLSETMTLGDNFNDVPMLELAGLGVAMDNAPDEVKQSARVVTSSNNQNGVSFAIKKYALKEE